MQEIKAAMFELTTVDATVAKHHAKEILPASTYTTPAIPMYGEPCANPLVQQSHTLTHPPVYMAEVNNYKMIGGCAFPIIDDKCVKPQMFAASTWETWEQAKGNALIKDNLIAYRGFIGHIKVDEKVINLCGNGSFNYAHWMTEFLPQLVLLKQLGIDLAEYKILVFEKSFPTMLEALSILGFSQTQLIPIKNLCFYEFTQAKWVSPVSNVVFQRPNANSVGKNEEVLASPSQALFHPEVIKKTRDTFLNLANVKNKENQPEKIFIKRTPGGKKSTRLVVNELEIQQLLENNGFVTIDPSLLDFESQISVFSNAKIIVSPSGAALLNMLWAPKGAEVVILMNNSIVANYWYFSNIAQALGHQICYVLGKTVQTGNWVDINHADFEIDQNELIKVINTFGTAKQKDNASIINVKKIRVLLAIQHTSVWPSLRSVYIALKKIPEIEVRVIKSPFIHTAEDQIKQLNELNELFKKENITLETLAENLVYSFKPHLIFLQNPYDSTRIRLLHSHNLQSLGIRTAYIPYGIEMGGGAENIQNQFSTDVQKQAWRVFLRSNRNRAMYAKHCAVGDSHTVVTGHPKFDNQQNFVSYPISAQLKTKIAGRKVVLWSPHFSVGLPASWSTYRIYNQMIMQQVEARPDVFFIIRPHPLFFKEMLRQQVWNESGEVEFRKLCAEKDNLWLDENADYMESFAASNAIMTDVGSFLLEYLPTKNPIMYLHHPEGFGLNDDGDLVDHYYRANLPEDIPPFIDMVSKGQDPMREERIGVTDEYLFGLDGKAGQRIADYIVEELSKELSETEWHPNPLSEEALQNKTNHYWKNAPSTLNAPPVFYELKDKAFKEALSLLPTLDYAIDLGCGEGRYTLPLSKKCKQLDALDISPKLIHVANKRKQKFNILNVSFVNTSYQEMQLKKQPDLFSCSDLTSSIIDNLDFAKLMHAIKTNLTEQGFLLLSDQFSLTQEDHTIQAPSGLVTKIRSLELFKNFMASLGLSIVSEATISESVAHGMTARLYLFRFSK